MEVISGQDRKPWVIFPQDQYETQIIDAKIKDRKPRFTRLHEKYEKEGIRRSVRAVFLVHVHGHPHLICLQKNQDGTDEVDLFGGSCQAGEDEKAALNRKLAKYIYNPATGQRCEWVIADLLSVWWRPNFDEVVLPYLPNHISRPKECVKVYQVTIPEKCVFMMPQGETLVAIPLFDLLRTGTEATYNILLRSVAACISRFSLTFYQVTE